jgi:hypothetical protein
MCPACARGMRIILVLFSVWQGYDNEILNRELLAKYSGNYEDVVAELSIAGLL